MGIVDDYISGDSSKVSLPETGGSDLVSQYLNSPSEEKPIKKVYIDTTPKPPISGISKEASDEFNAQPSKQGGANPRDSELIEGITSAPANTFKAIGEDFMSGLKTVGEGTNDILANKPASGIGKIGIGALSSLVSPISGASKELIEKPVTQLTGNKQAGEVAGLVATSGLPIIKGAKAAVAALPKNRALKTLIESIGPENLPDVVRQMKENPRLSPADLSPRVKQDVQSLFVTDGPHINYIDNAVKARAAGAKDAVEGAIDSSLGNTVNAVDKLNELKTNIRNVGSQKIQPALENTGAVNVKPVVEEIDKILKPGVNSVVSNETQLSSPEINKKLGFVRQYLTDDKSMRTDPKQLHQIQSMLRSSAESYLNSSSGQDRQVGKALMNVRNGIVDAIDAAGKPAQANAAPVTGYKQSLSNYRDEYHVQDAFSHGHDAILSNSKAVENRPEFFKQWVKNASPEELNAAKEGARVAIDTQINGFKYAARRGIDVGEVEFNRQRIEALFGKDEADKLFTKLKHEREIADTNNKLTQGSQTAMRAASKEAFALPEKSKALINNAIPALAIEAGSSYMTGTPLIGTAAYFGAKGAVAAKDAIATKLAREHNARYSKYALPTEGPDRDALISHLDAIANKPAKQSLVRRAARTGVRLGNLIAP